MPATPPVRKAMRIARWAPVTLAAAATRTFAADGEPHADVAGDRGEHGADEEEDRAPDPLRRVVGGEQEQQEEDQDREHAERAELAVEVRRRAFLHRLGDLLHLRRALVGRQDLAREEVRHTECGEPDQAHQHHDDQIAPVQGNQPAACGGQVDPSHASSL